jgi:hypothetical protein
MGQSISRQDVDAMGVDVVSPNELMATLKEEDEPFQRKVLTQILSKPYEAGRISSS